MNVTIQVKAGSKKGPLVERGSDGGMTVYVRERAVDGKANAAVVKLVSEYFEVPKTCVEITHGLTSKTKLLTIVK